MAGKTLNRALPPSHPGELISRLLDEHGVSKRAASKAIGISHTQLYNLINGDANVTPSMAVYLGKFFGNGPNIWLRLQDNFNIYQARDKNKRKLKKVISVQELVATH